MSAPISPSDSALDDDLPDELSDVDSGATRLFPELMDPANPSWRDEDFGDYRILRKLGQGGMSHVFEAVQKSLNRRVTLKVLSKTDSLTKRRVKRFDHEAKAVARLEHPRIVRAYAHGEERGHFFLALQYIRGRDLAEFVRGKRNGRFPSSTDFAEASTAEFDPESSSESARVVHEHVRSANQASLRGDHFKQIALIGQQVAEALQYAHEHGVIHRDIKPSNLLIDEDNNVWIADFGLALLEAAHRVTATGKALGTLRYSSPEQADGKKEVDARTDVYSLGATLYELATLSPAFDDDEPSALLNSILNREPERPVKRCPQMPNDLECVILKAMSKSPSDRYQTALEMAVDLQRFTRNEPVHAKQPTWYGRSRRWIQRNPLISSLVACLVVLLGLLIGQVYRRGELVVELTDARNDLKVSLKKEQENLSSLAEHKHVQGRHYFAARMENVVRLAEIGEFERVGDRLKQLSEGPEDPPGFLRRYLAASCNKDVGLYTEHQDEVLALAVCEQLNLIVSGDKQGKVFVRNADSGMIIKVIDYGHEVQDLVFSPDRRLLTICGMSGEIHVYETSDWSLLKQWKAHEKTVKALVFLPDGKTLISGSRDDDLAYWSTTDWTLIRRLKNTHNVVQDIAMSADGRWLATGGDDGEAKVWRAETGEHYATFNVHKLAVLRTAISEDGRLIAGGGYESFFCLWDRESRSLLAKIDIAQGEQIWSLKFVPGSKSLMVGDGRGELRVFDVSNPRRPVLIRRRTLHKGSVRGIGLLGSPQRIVTASGDSTVRVVTGPFDRLQRVRSTALSRGVYWSPNGERYLIRQRRKVSIFRRGGELIEERPVPKRRPEVVYRPNGSLVLANRKGNAVDITAISEDGRETTVTLKHAKRVLSFWLSASGQLGLMRDDSHCSVWSLTEGTKLAEFAAPANLHNAAFSPDDSLIAMATEGQVTLKSWRRAKESPHNLMAPGCATGLYAVTFSPDGKRLAAGGFDGQVFVWNVHNWKLEHNLSQGSLVVQIAFSNDGQYLAVGSEELRIWHAFSGQMLARFGPALAPGKRYESLAFSPSDDCLIATFDVKGGSLLYEWDAEK